MSRADAVTVEWHPEFRDGAAVPVAVSMKIGEHHFVPLDPDDREMVKRLANAIRTIADEGCEHGYRCATPACLQVTVAAALRSLIEPPKPPEPLGLGAVVEDADGDIHVRVVSGPSDAYWHCATDSDGDKHWADIAAVRVLSEGVTP